MPARAQITVPFPYLAARLRGRSRMGEETAMTETTAETTAPAEAPTEAPAQEPDWKAQARKWEERAKENKAKADSNDAAAARLAELEEANKTAEQKAQERLEAAERRASELESKAILAEAAAGTGIPKEILAGPASTSAEDLAAFADLVIAFKGATEPTPSGAYVPAEGRSPEATALNGKGLEDALRTALGI